jgi:hypothetical protein
MVHGWIVSTIAPEHLAEHLSRAFVARGPDGSAYLLRYYDPWVLPVLYYQAPQHWWKELITPIAAWWVPKADTKIQRWGRISGLSASQANPLPPLLIDQALWQALIGDPLPRRLLQSVETLLPGLLDAPCRGVRLACIEQLVDGARKAGLSTHDDLHDYVFLSLTQGTTRLASDRRWLWAMHAATAGEGRLGDLYSTACRQQA